MRGRTSESEQEGDGEHRAERDGEGDHPRAGVERPRRPPGAELLPDDDLARDRDGVEHEREEEPELERDLVRAELGVPDARDDRACEQERADQRGVRAKMNLPTESRRRAQAGRPARGRPARPGARRARRSRAPMHVWASAVPQADPSIPQSKP